MMTRRSVDMTQEPGDEEAAFEQYLQRPNRRRLAKVIDLFHRHVWSVALRVAGNHEDAADLSQDVFLSLLLRPPPPGTIRSSKGWLTCRVITAARHRRRGAERRIRREAIGAEVLAAESGLPPEEMEEVREAIEDLPERIRTAIEYRYLGGLRNAEIAEAIGRSIESVERDLRHGREILRKRLRETVLGALVFLEASTASGGIPPPPGFHADLYRILRMGEALGTAPDAVSTAGHATNLTRSLLTAGGAIMGGKGVLAGAIAAVIIVLGILLFSSIHRDPAPVREIPALASRPRSAPEALPPGGSAAPRNSGKMEDPLPQPIDLGAADRDLDIFGVVKNTAGKPIPGARIATFFYPFKDIGMLDLEGSQIEEKGPETRSASDGMFLLRLHRGDMADLRISATGYARKMLQDRLAGESVTVILDKASVLEVIATDEGRRPVAGAEVKFYKADDTHEDHTMTDDRRGKTDADGRCVFNEVEGGIGSITLSRPGFGDAGARVEIQHGETCRVDITMPAGRTLGGRVVDAETGEPIEGARVGAACVLLRPVPTDAEGRFRYPGWPAEGISELTVVAEGYGRQAKVVPPEGEIEFALLPGDRATGRVLGRDGSPVEGARVGAVASRHEGRQQEIDTRSATTGADGTFTLTSLRRDLPHTLVIQARGYGRCLLDFDGSLAEEGEIALGDLVLPEARSIEGKVLDGEGRPLGSVLVEARGSNDDRGSLIEGWKEPVQDVYGSRRVRRTDDLGRFRFPGLAPGEYALTLKVESMRKVQTTVTLPPDRDVLDVVLDAQLSWLIVIVRDPDGKPAVGAFVSASDVVGRSGNQQIYAYTDDEGRAVLRGLPRSAVKVYAHGAQAESFLDPDEEREVVPEGQEVTFVLERPAWIRGVVLGPGGEPLPGITVAAGVRIENSVRSMSRTSDENGAFEIPVKSGLKVDLRLTETLRIQDGKILEEESPFVGECPGVVAPASGITIRAKKAREPKPTTP